MQSTDLHKISFSSSDFDEFAMMIKNAELEHQLMESGQFQGEIALVFTKHVITSQFKLNKIVQQNGVGSPGYITFVIWSPNSSFNWRGNSMKHGSIGVLWKNEHHSITGSDFIGFPVSVNEEFFKNRCLQRGYSKLFEILKKHELFSVSEYKLEGIRKLVSTITSNNSYSAELLNTMIEHQLVDEILDCLMDIIPEEITPQFSDIKLNKAVSFIQENVSDVITVGQVSEQLKIPERTLRHLFQTKFQLSPKSYIQKLRLNAVRKRIKNRNEPVEIAILANEFNFWHKGQFASDYRKTFGELPSETMNRTTPQIPLP